jgi:hypothetical protein
MNLKIEQTTKGMGVFTMQDISKGEVVSEWIGQKYSVNDIPHPYQLAHDLYTQVGPLTYLGPSGGIDDMINHSCDPNCGLFFESDKIYCKTIKDINAGEELTWDYSTTMDKEGINGLDGWKMECECGSPNCRGIIQGFNTVPKDIQKKYIAMGIVPSYISDKYR